MKIKQFRPLIASLSMLLILALTSCATTASTPMSLDQALIESLASRDLETSRALLEQGASPEAIPTKTFGNNAVCTAVDNRTSEYLELLVEFGASPNAYWPNAHSQQRTPLACAIQMWNFEAFHYLLDNGADPTVNLNPDGPKKFEHFDTAFTYALGYSVLPMALELLKRYELRPGEIQYAKHMFESSGATSTHPWNYARQEIIDWLSERVNDFNPREATPGKPLKKGECLFTSRDRRDGLKKGTLCPRPGDM